MRAWLAVVMLMLAALWPAAAFCAGTPGDIPTTNIPPAAIPPAAPPTPPRASTPIRAVLSNISVAPAGAIAAIYPVSPAVAPVLALWRQSLRQDLSEAGLFSGNGPPLSLQVRVMEITLTGHTVTVFARYQLWRPGAEQPLTDMDILTDAGVTSTYGMNPIIDAARVMLDPRRIGQAIGLNIADFVLRLEDYATRHPFWAAPPEIAAGRAGAG